MGLWKFTVGLSDNKSGGEELASHYSIRSEDCVCVCVSCCVSGHQAILADP